MEAEINSPMCRLRPGETCTLDTEWFPTRATSKIRAVTDAGIVVESLQAASQDGKRIKVGGTFGVFFPGRLVAHLYGEHGTELQAVTVANVDPRELVLLETEVASPGKTSRISLHLEDRNGLDRGSLQEVQVILPENH